MIVVCDATPLNYLILIRFADILRQLFGSVATSQAVVEELLSPGAPDPVRQWVDAGPQWLHIYPINDIEADLVHLDRGEAQVLSLARRLKADLVLLDEKKARQTARECGLAVSGTLGVLDRAAAHGIVDLSVALARLRRTSFRASPKLFELVQRRSPTP